MALFGKKKKEEKKLEPQIEGGQEKVEEVAAPKAELPKGGDEHAYAAIVAPHLTEKSSAMGSENKYVFRVAREANKFEIKKAVEKLYKVKVVKIAVSHKPGKVRRLGRHEGVKTGFKKAIITLVKGDKIDIIS